MSRERSAEYSVRIEKSARKALAPGGMSPRRQRSVSRFIKSHLISRPLERLPGKTKELRGRYKGIFQFDIDDHYRLWYRVDSTNRVVYIQYIGPHPKW